jgi:hypothetical protein
MVYGHHQVGHDTLEQTRPAAIPILEALELTYADIQRIGLDTSEPSPEGSTIDQTILDGDVTSIEDYADYGVTSAFVVDVDSINHSIASVFWDFMNSQSTIWHENEYVEDVLFVEPFYATGYPITDAYWTTIEIDGTATDIVWQCFERRCLTYTPENAPEGQIESNNAGRHYNQWRYGTEP